MFDPTCKYMTVYPLLPGGHLKPARCLSELSPNPDALTLDPFRDVGMQLSLLPCLDSLEGILKHVIVHHLEISERRLKVLSAHICRCFFVGRMILFSNCCYDGLQECAVVYVIPDLFDRWELMELTEMLMTRMGFAKLTFMQESVASSFGGIQPSSCVVDIGDQKTSVALVEDGLVLPESRMVLPYGCADMQRVLLYLFQHGGLPLDACKPLHAMCDDDEFRLLSENVVTAIQVESCRIVCCVTGIDHLFIDSSCVIVYLCIQPTLPSTVLYVQQRVGKRRRFKITLHDEGLMAAMVLDSTHPRSLEVRFLISLIFWL